jgi:hypothetical protein
MTDAATREPHWEASQSIEDGHRRRSGLDYGRGPDGPNDDCADARNDDGRGSGTDMADSTDAMFDRLREAAAAHDTSELNAIAGIG